MPTGYTSGILDGKITTFEQFTKTCMRAFGATIHMKEDSLDREYVPREVDSYYFESIEKWTNILKEIESASDDEILSKKEKELDAQISHYREKIKHAEEYGIKLQEIKTKTEHWIPPTEDHANLKKFMLEQLDMTIKSDCDASYYIDGLNRAYNESFNLDVDRIRNEYIKDAKSNLEFSKENLEKEMCRVNDSNKWVEQLLNSI